MGEKENRREVRWKCNVCGQLFRDYLYDHKFVTEDGVVEDCIGDLEQVEINPKKRRSG